VNNKIGILRFADRMNKMIELILSTFGGITFFLVTILVIVEIVRRYIFGYVFEWGQDAAIYFMVTAVTLYFCVTQIHRGHLVMAAVIEYLNHKKLYRLVGLAKIASSFVTSALCLTLSVAGTSMLEYSYSMGIKSDSLMFVLWPFHVVFILSIGLMGLVAFFQIIEDVVAYKNGDHLSGELDLIADI
jgi:TRAP-type C4-dicarboxylate transport system permease small subunit